MLYLAHSKDVIAVQVLALLQVLLYFRYEFAQNEIGKDFYRYLFFMNSFIGQHCDTKFFIRTNELLERVISSIGKPLSMYG